MKHHYWKLISLLATVFLLTMISMSQAQETTISAEDMRSVAENANWGDNTSLEFTETEMAILGNGLPDHETLESYPAVSVVDNKTTYMVTLHEIPMRIVVPLQPVLAEEKTPVRVGLIGIAVSGGLIYAPYEADGETVALDAQFEVDGIPFIDACNGHPNPFAVQYHYHGVPYCITDVIDEEGEHSTLLGYALDGFPIYGPQDEGGESISLVDLDECSGHVGSTPEFPDGVYHYHITEESPYTMPCYSGEIELSDDPIDLLFLGVDLSVPFELPKIPGVPSIPIPQPNN